MMRILTFALILPVMGCGGTLTGDSSGYTALTSTSGGAAAPVRMLALDAGALLTSISDGTFDHSAAEARIGAVTAAVDAASVLSDGMTYVAGLETAAGDVKLIAVETLSADMPGSSSASYSGGAVVQVTDTTSTYSVTMDASVDADFDSGAVTVTLDTVASGGSVTTGTDPAAVYVADGFEQVIFADLAISGSGFSADAGSSAVARGFDGGGNVLGNAPVLAAEGVFAGPEAEAMAGVAAASAASGQVIATFSAAQ